MYIASYIANIISTELAIANNIRTVLDILQLKAKKYENTNF